MVATFAIVYESETKIHRRTIADDDGRVSIGMMPDGVTEAVICEHPGFPSSYHPLLPDEKALVVEGGTTASDYYDWVKLINAVP